MPVRSVPRAEESYLGSGTVLVVDDEEVVRTVAKEMLERFGFKVLTAENGLEGIKQFEQHSRIITAVLLDMTMPDMSGEEVFRRLREHQPDARVILSSGYAEREMIRGFASQGLTGYLQKPYRLETLLEVIQHALVQEA